MDIYLKEAEENNKRLKAKELLPPKDRSLSREKITRCLTENRLTYKDFSKFQDVSTDNKGFKNPNFMKK